MASTIARRGNSRPAHLPKDATEHAGPAEGSAATIDHDQEGSVVVRPAQPRHTLQTLLDGVTTANRHPETDWRGPVGREAFLRR